LRGQLLMLGELWNALLQRREDVYRRERCTLSKREQYKEIIDLRLARLRQGRFWRDQSLRTVAGGTDVVAHWHDCLARRRMVALGTR
jgi:hypothetical protein